MKRILIPFFCIVFVCLHVSCDDENNEDDEEVTPIENMVKFGGKSYDILGEAELDPDGQYEDYENLERMDVEFLLGNVSSVCISLIVERGEHTPVPGIYEFRGESANNSMQIFRGWYDDENDERFDFVSGKCTVTVVAGIYTFLFDFVCKNQQSLTGGYQGKLLLISGNEEGEEDNEDEEDEDEDEEIEEPVENIVVVNGINYPIVREAELDLDGQYYNYEHLERMDVEFVLDDDKISSVCISLIVENGNHAPVTGSYTFEGRSANDAMQIFRGWYDAEDDERYDFKSGNCIVTIEQDIYTFFFEFECEGQKTVKGSYQGTLVLISEED